MRKGPGRIAALTCAGLAGWFATAAIAQTYIYPTPGQSLQQGPA